MTHVAKIIGLVGSSDKSWQDAAQVALEEAKKTIHGKTGVEIRDMTAKVDPNTCIWKDKNLNMVKKYNNYVALVVLAMSLALLSTTAIQATPANAANANTTQQAGAAANQTGEKAQAGAANMTQQGKSTANQTGEKAQAGAANVTQEAKSGANQAGQTAQSLMNKTGESLKSFANKTGEVLQKINPLK